MISVVLVALVVSVIFQGLMSGGSHTLVTGQKESFKVAIL